MCYVFIAGTLLVGITGGCRQREQKFVYLPHYESFLSDSLLHQQPTLYEYVLVEAPPADKQLFIGSVTDFAQKLKPTLLHHPPPYSYVVKFYEATAETDLYRQNKRNPNILSHTYLQDNPAAYLGTYYALTCEQDPTKQIVKVSVKDSLNSQGMPVNTETVLWDGCERSR